MTEAEWLACEDPIPLLVFLQWVPVEAVDQSVLDGRGQLERGGGAQREAPGLPGSQPPVPEAIERDRKARLFACACCRRIWNVFGDDIWTQKHAPSGSSPMDSRGNPGPTGQLEDLFDDEISRRALETAERYCDGRTPAEELRRAGDAAWELTRAAYEYFGNADYRLGDHYCGSEHEESEQSYLTARCASLACVPRVRVAVGELARASREVIESGGCGIPNKPPTEGRVQAAILRDIYGSPFRPVTFPSGWRTSTAVALAAQMYEARDFGAMPILADALQDAGCDSADVLVHCRGPGPHVRGCWVVDRVLGRE